LTSDGHPVQVGVVTDHSTRAEGPPVAAAPELTTRSNSELEELARNAVSCLAERPDPEAFAALLRLSAVVGESLGISARALAVSGSWAQVGEAAGTTRQAAWSRWSS
jgi:hypothetical protein